MSITAAINRLEQLCNSVPSKLKSIDEQVLAARSNPLKWSKKEIIGHLIDSAANNHQRFVRGQFEDNPQIFYNQNEWVSHNFYQQLPVLQLIDFWQSYNQQLIHLLKQVPSAALQRTCRSRTGESLTLDFLINDYVQHMEHHLQQLLA